MDVRELIGLGILGFVLTACATATAPAAAPAEPATATANELNVAFELYQEAKYHEAASAFAKAYEESGDSSALAGQARSLQMAGECREAAVIYDQFLALEPDPTYNNAVRSMLEHCTE